jgi:citrate lyase subunit beta/citryl-CoA lyase
VNPLDSPFGADDLAAVVPLAPDALLLPKVSTLGDLARVDRVVGRLEQAAGLPVGGIRFHLLVETVAGVLGVETLAAGSTRNAALLFGAGDLARETGARRTPSRLGELHALSQVLLAARGRGSTPSTRRTSPCGIARVSRPTPASPRTWGSTARR